MDLLKTINPKMTLPTRMSGASSLAFPMTASERAAGRFLRAPDHDAGTGGGEGGAAEGADAGAAAAAGAEGEAKPGEGATAAEGADAASGGDAGGEADAGKGAEGEGGEDDSSIAGGAGAKKDGEEGDAKPSIIGAPEGDYDVKVPAELAEKGMTFDKEVFDLVAPELKAMDLSNDAAQRLTNVYAEKVVPALVERGQRQAEAAQETRSAEIRKEWADASRADPEIGGANFDKTVDAAAAVWDKFGIKPKEGIRLLLDESGIGNHPDMLRFLSRVASVTGEGKFVQSDGAGSDNRPVWDRVYGQPEPAK
jgi:hypothetical protein